jgi:hypothetical protein
VVGTTCIDDHAPIALPVPAGRDVQSLLRCGAQALYVEGDLQADREWFDAAYRAAEMDGDRNTMALAALGMCGLWVHEHRSTAAAALVEARLRAALAAVDQGSPVALRLRIRLAGEADYRTGEHDAILALLKEARRVGDPAARAEAASLAHHCVLGPDHGTLRHALAQELIAEGFRTGRRSDLLMGLLWRAVDRFLDGDPHAERSLGELRCALAQENHLAVGFVAEAIEVMRSIRAGRFDQAETQAVACRQRGRAAGDADATGWYGAQLVAIRWFQGRIAELVPSLREIVHSPTLSAVDNSYLGALAVAAAAAGDHREAAGALARLRGASLAQLPRSSSWLVALYGAVESAYLLDDAPASAAAYDLLAPFARLPMVASLGVACFGSVRHALGVASLTLADPHRAVDHLRAAVHDNVAIGHWPAAVLSRARLAEALVRRAGSGDAVEAERELDLAAKEAAGLGMVLPGGTARSACAGRAATQRVGRPRSAACRRRGRHWEITLGYRSVLVENSRGMQYLATLIANPGHEIRAVELASGPGLRDAVAAHSASSSAQPVLDDEAKREYRQRLSALQAELDAYESTEDFARADQVRSERDWLIAELAAAAGLGGRVRAFANGEERARIAVGKAIRRALDRIATADATVGHELRAAVHTGIRCCYRPY